jgi:hypothetical protein
LRPAHSRRHLYVTRYTEGFSHFVTSMTAPVASGWSGCRVGLAPTGKRRLVTAHAISGHSATAWDTSNFNPSRTTGLVQKSRYLKHTKTLQKLLVFEKAAQRWSLAGEQRRQNMRSIVAASVVAICGLMGSAAIAAQRPALCKLVVKGKTYINGRCNFEDFGEGDFAIGVLRDHQRIPGGGFYFAYVIDVHGNTAEAKWNEDPKDLHANAPLGTLTRNGACWENAIAQICAR